MAEGSAETVAGSESVDHVDEVRRHFHALGPGLAQDALGPLLDHGEFDAEIEQCIRGAVRIGLADGDLALFAVADGDGDMHLLFAFNTVQSGQGVGNEFLYIIAAVIGGCLLTGGFGTAIGAAIGAFIFGMTNQGIVYAGWNPDWFKFFLGAMLLFAVIANNSFRSYAAKR